MSSNAQQQTRGLSAGDWIRLKRLRGATRSGYSYTPAGGTVRAGDLTTNVDINPTEPGQNSHSKAMLIPYEAAGKSRTLRPASKWTDFIASQAADYVTQASNGSNGTILSLTKVCSSTTTILNTKIGVCRPPIHGVNRITNKPYTGANPAIHPLTVFKTIV